MVQKTKCRVLGESRSEICKKQSSYAVVKEVRFRPYKGKVRDLTIENTQSYNIEGLGVHNSVGGSLIARLLGITAVDPLEYDLLFARFINEERLDYPDIDLDFEDCKRDEVRTRLQELYGEDNIAGVSTFLTLKGRMAIRDVSRVFDVPYDDVDEFAKVIEYEDHGEESIAWTSKNTEEGVSFTKKYPDIIKYAMKLEGQVRGAGQHASAIIVSAEPITNGLRAHIVRRKGVNVINWGKDESEYCGLMKLDVLGLNTLSILNNAKNIIEEIHNKKIDFLSIPLDNKGIYDYFKRAKNAGIFQFNTEGVGGLCKRIKPEVFDHIVAINALYRPGTLRSGMVDEYVDRHTTQEWECKNPDLFDITKDTYGIILYQEQVMHIMHKLAGLPWKEADKVRKIIGKSKGADKLKPFKDAFVEGCHKCGTMNRSNATSLWEDIESFGGYGFNKSHAVEYTMIAYWCAWMKYYYPAEFTCASLSFGKDDKKEELIIEAFNNGIKVFPPKVGLSDPLVWTVKGKNLYCPFIEVKGIGEKSALKIKDPKNKNGFFNKDGKTESALGKKLKLIGAYDLENTPENISDYLAFDINQDPKKKFPSLHKMIGDQIYDYDFDDIRKGHIGFDGVIKTNMRYRDERVSECTRCSLSEECKSPKMSATGKYNVWILGDFPGWDEERKAKPLSGDVGEKTIWHVLKDYGLKRSLFHVGFLTRCYPKLTKKPRVEHLARCNKWLTSELTTTESKIILAFGNNAISSFTNDAGGIMKRNATTEYCEKAQAWVCWCVSPFAYMLGDNEQKALFLKGIDNFVRTLNRFPGFKEINL